VKLSIVITSRNRKAFLLSCINSIKASRFKDYELVLVDDASSDGTELLQASDIDLPHVQIFHSRENLMLVQARNKCRELAKGEYILFVDDDNILDPDMIDILVSFADRHKEYGLLGPSMYYHDEMEKYLDFQSINFFTGKTSGCIDTTDREICPSDGIPNVFLIKREVFDQCGPFDAELVQTFTEPDFAFNARRSGYLCGIVKSAKTYHRVRKADNQTPRGLGAQFKQKAYCLIRNRSVIVQRYGRMHQKLVYLIFFSWVWPAIYSLRMLQFGRFDLIRLYWAGFKDGVRHMLTGRLVNSLPKFLQAGKDL